MAILGFFIGHWFLSLFFQTFFLHRYASHKMVLMGRKTERLFYFLTFLSQGASFLNPRAYAIMHRMHHTFSDTEKDPHSPHFFRDIFRLMFHTKKIYVDLASGKTVPEKPFDGNYPVWPLMDKISDLWIVRIGFAVAYILFYVMHAQSPWLFLLLPVHFLMGPVHGALVNWCGHKYGYSNYDNGDHSKNTLPVDVFLFGELMQNNHHKSPNRINFAKKGFELDPGFQVIRLMNWLGIVRIRKNP